MSLPSFAEPLVKKKTLSYKSRALLRLKGLSEVLCEGKAMRKILVLTIVLLAVSSTALAMSNSDCLDCHSDETLTKMAGGKEISLFIDESVYGASIHGDLDCTDCHEDLVGVEDEHEEELEAVSCSNCHDDVAEEMMASAPASEPTVEMPAETP